MLCAGAMSRADAATEPFVVGVSAASQTPSGNAMVEGLRLALQEFEESGGRHVRCVVLNDAGDPKRAVDNVRQLIDEERLVCLAASSNDACAEAISPLLAAARMPLVGVASGAERLRTQEHHWLYHTRASRGVEAGAIVTQLDSMGITRIAVVHTNDSFGQEGADGAHTELSRLAIRAEAVLGVPTGTQNMASTVAALGRVDAQAVIVIADAAVLVAFVHGLRASGQHQRVISVSEVSAEYCIRLLGADASGVGFSEVLPNPQRTALPVVRDYQAALKRAASASAPSYAGLEGYVDGRVIGWALRRWERSASGSMNSLLSVADIDLGGFRLRYSPADKRGTSFVEMMVVSADGRLNS